MKHIAIRNTSQTPIYQQLFEQISAQIINGDLTGDEALPSMRTIAKELRVSIITIKKTWELLEQGGFIYTIKGKGSYVKDNPESKLKTKKKEAVQNLLKDALITCNEYDITHDELLDIVSNLYKSINQT